ncbi:hypothetical protein F0562_002319 [Nyssa sinensis]|uniref:BSD domain-containing protein n=1 Tax=Nyssa sinensis TaxID=561372 RepID=A0A5J5C5H5_9ASTE|nr:hypothetical protein F0562_002319 [Nyssa sinensis]
MDVYSRRFDAVFQDPKRLLHPSRPILIARQEKPEKMKKNYDQGANCGGDTPTNSGNVGKDLSDWQERHAPLVLSEVKEMSQLRFRLCPRHLKERQFWRIYYACQELCVRI